MTHFAMMTSYKFTHVSLFIVFASLLVTDRIKADTLWSENFDDAGASSRWSVSSGTWEMGIPTSGPNGALSGLRLAGTVLAGNYSDNVDSRLQRIDSFVVPTHNPKLRFWHWYTFVHSDFGQVQVSADGGATWNDISPAYTYSSSEVWTRASIDLSNYAGQSILIGFRLRADAAFNRVGWYIDDIEVTSEISPSYPNPEDFEDESSTERWTASRGTWEIGVPTSGPGQAFSGSQLAGTVLAGNYGDEIDSRLERVDPLTVPNENPKLRFWHWYTFVHSDFGQVQASTDGGTTWENISPTYTYGSSEVWTRASLDLSAYAGQSILIGFRIRADAAFNRVGWYIDDIEITSGKLSEYHNPEGFEKDDPTNRWAASRGTWEIGTPTSGPSQAYSGSQLAGTVLAGNYSDEVDSRLQRIDPFIVPTQNPKLNFWHWYTFVHSDFGQVQVSADGGTTWEDISPAYQNSSSEVWTRTSIDLSTYAGQSILIGFRIRADAAFNRVGWYIDDIEITSDTLTQISDISSHPEETTLTFSVQAIGSNIVHSLADGAPLGASIDSDTGIFNWTPSEQQGPGIFDITVEARIENGNLDPVDQSTFLVEIEEVNAPPVLEPIGAKSIDEGSELSFTVNASDQDNTNIAYPGFLERERFESLTLGDWTAISLASNANWETEDFGDRYVRIFGFGADVASDDWLISPKMDFGSSSVETLRFTSLKQFAGPDIEILASVNYDGNGNPNTATWIPLSAILPVQENIWIDSGLIDLSSLSSGNLYLAFRYTSTGTGNGQAPLWQIDDIEIRAVLPPVLQTLTYSLDAGAPAGAAINPSTGEFTWTPDQDQGDTQYAITIRVTDNGTNPPNLSASETITVTVGNVEIDPNVTPVLNPIGNKIVSELSLLNFSATTSNEGVLANTFKYSLAGTPPPGAMIDANTGIFSWTPNETQGPGNFDVTFRVENSVNSALFAEELVTVSVNEINTAPLISPISDKTVNAGSNLSFSISASDLDQPSNTLSFSLKAGSPNGASIDPTSGQFSWMPSATQAGSAYEITVIVTDDNALATNQKNLSVSETFNIQVNQSGSNQEPENPTVFFISNESGRDNVWRGVLNQESITEREQLTFYTDRSVGGYDIHFASETLVYYVDDPAIREGGQIYVTDFEGTDPLLIPNQPNGTTIGIPEISPDGLEVAISGGSNTNGNGALEAYIIGIDGSNLRKIVNANQPRGVNTHTGAAHWLNDGRIIMSDTIQWSLVDNNRDIYIYENGTMTPAGGNQGHGESYSRLSPDGTRLLVQTTEAFSNKGLSLMSWPNGPQTVIFPRGGSQSYTPSGWLDNNTIMYSVNGDLFFANAQGNEVKNLTNTPSIQEWHLRIATEMTSGTSRIINISTRGFIGTGEGVMIAGFIVEGTQPLDVVLRASGPSIGISDGVEGFLPDPTISVFSGNQGSFADSNNDWTENGDTASLLESFVRVGAQPFQDDKDSALKMSLEPGSYALFVNDNGEGQGVGLVEVFDESIQLGNNKDARLLNISTRAFVGSGDKTMIAGFWVEGDAPLKILAQAVGEGIAGDVSNPLSDPQISIFDLSAGDFIADGTNDNWGDSPNVSEISDIADRIGARKLAPGSKDAASVVTLTPGQGYAIFVSDTSGAEGIAVVEVFAVYSNSLQ